MVFMDQFRRIKTLGRQGLSHSEIARKLNLNRKTVSRYINQKEAPSYKPRSHPTRSSPITGFEQKISNCLQKAPGLSASEVYEQITQHGYKGSERTVQRYIRQSRSGQTKERFFEQTYELGEQAQFDFKECIQIPFLKEIKTIHLHFSTLPASDAFFIRAYPTRTYECYMDGIHEFFESIGGQPKAIRIDNLAPCVKKVLSGSKRLYTDAFQSAMNHYGFEVLPCSPGKGNEKGDVERDIRTFAKRILNLIALENLKFKDFSELNNWLKIYCEQRRSEKTKEKLEEEKKVLQPLMPRDEDVLCRTCESTVSKYGTVKLVKSQYSVPDHWIGSQVRIVSGPYEVKISRKIDKTEVLHPRVPEGKHSLSLEHVLPSLLRKPQALVRWSHREVLFKYPIFEDLYKFLKKRSEVSLPEVEFLKVINLTLSHDFSEVQAATELCMASPEPMFSKQVSELLIGGHRPQAGVPEQSTITCNLKPYDQFIGG